MIDLNKVHKGMNVVTSDGKRLGTVKELLGQVMFLDGVEQATGPGDVSIPLAWIISVDKNVGLAKSREQVEQEWQSGSRQGL
jgi:hypothetical protein